MILNDCVRFVWKCLAEHYKILHLPTLNEPITFSYGQNIFAKEFCMKCNIVVWIQSGHRSKKTEWEEYHDRMADWNSDEVSILLEEGLNENLVFLPRRATFRTGSRQ